MKAADGYYLVKIKTIPPGHTCRFELRSELPLEELSTLEHAEVNKVYSGSANGVYRKPDNFFFWSPDLRDAAKGA